MKCGAWGWVALALIVNNALALDNGLARKPAMGYNTWSSYGVQVNESDIRLTADLLVSLGLKDAGYEFLVVDDAWQEKNRTKNGSLAANQDRFPFGMAALGAFVHSRGLKFGMYSDAGAKTCAGYPGSRGHETDDAAAFAAWGVDYLKYDNCYAREDDPVQGRYLDMRDALNATGRPIVFSLCEWGVDEPWLWAPKVGNSWRTTADSTDSWASLVENLDNSVGLARYAGGGGWNDPDMLQVGNPGLTLGEQRANFALWAVLRSPLMISTRLQDISPEALAILKAREVIAMHQDELPVAGDLIWKQGSKEVYAGPLAGGDRAVVFFNRARPEEGFPGAQISVRWTQLGYSEMTLMDVRDAFKAKKLGAHRRGFSAYVAPHDVLVLRLTPLAAPSARRELGRQQDDGWRPWHGQPMYDPHWEDSVAVQPRHTIAVF